MTFYYASRVNIKKPSLLKKHKQTNKQQQKLLLNKTGYNDWP